MLPALLTLAAFIALLLGYEIADFILGQTLRPRWFRRWLCGIEGHDTGHPSDEPKTDRCLRCGGEVG
jgi:hypothetical protein